MPTGSKPEDFLKRMLLLSNNKPGRRVERKSSHGNRIRAPAMSFTRCRGCLLAELKQRSRCGDLREAAATALLTARREATKHTRTRERSSMTCCCSRTCSRRNSISCSSRVRLRSFKEVCRFRDACADSFSFCSQRESAPQGPQPAALPQQEHPAGSSGTWGARDDSHRVPKREEGVCKSEVSPRLRERAEWGGWRRWCPGDDAPSHLCLQGRREAATPACRARPSCYKWGD